MSQDRRESLRAATSFPAHILTDNGRRVSCTLADRSASGALLTVAGALGLPDTFTLIVGHSGEIRDVRVAWRQTDRLGVMFA
ncbi:PilZ domain-containing protein [Methylobacterium mesophilicum SR1.6/6]|uniref:PilZ domain-containing protein n=1 Tax=Methylobacterium mesophilicum SR1.6/6 TaxID=908290 RepID=A0A6B9FYJ4_9HYPH|nr:PilZ domain-containing protein [Methylobacterium mesophilicum]QGY05558.1 PilZ domain-containing protein [Methylobacterium mesophilicum SR1.6/6]